MDTATRDAMLTLNLTPGLGPTLTRRCVEAMGSPVAVLGAKTRELIGVRGIGPKRGGDIRREIDGLSDGRALSREKELIEQLGVTVLMIGDEGYPPLLRHIPDPPPVLYVRGRWRRGDALALAIVGTRRCTAYGREQADRFASVCSQAGLCIVSGGARGVDAAAHRAVLRLGGTTIAVLGSGLARPYPPEHEDLFDTIAQRGRDGGEGASACDDVSGEGTGGGAVISEMPMATPPLAENFPRRNRIISGLSLGVLIIEAPNGSGAMITARLAAEEQGREVMVLPGRVDSRSSAGCHKIIREGWGTLVSNPGDVLDALGDAGQTLKAGMAGGADGEASDEAAAVFGNKSGNTPHSGPHASAGRLTETQSRLLEVLDGPRSIDQLAARTGLMVSMIQAEMTMLEIRGVVKRERGLWRRSRAG